MISLMCGALLRDYCVNTNTRQTLGLLHSQ